MLQTSELVPFQAVHLDLLTPDIEISGVLLKAMMEARMKGPAFTLYVNGRVEAIAGVAVVWDGVGEAWGVVSPEAPILQVTRIARAMLQETKKHLDLRRIQTFTLLARPYEWVRALGFKQEGVVSRYGPNGEDLRLWAIT